MFESILATIDAYILQTYYKENSINYNKEIKIILSIVKCFLVELPGFAMRVFLFNILNPDIFVLKNLYNIIFTFYMLQEKVFMVKNLFFIF